MRLISFLGEGGARVGAVRDDKVVDLAKVDPTIPTTMRELIAGGAGGSIKRAQSSIRVVTPHWNWPT